jgi:hypothetical protein
VRPARAGESLLRDGDRVRVAGPRESAPVATADVRGSRFAEAFVDRPDAPVVIHPG